MSTPPRPSGIALLSELEETVGIQEAQGDWTPEGASGPPPKDRLLLPDAERPTLHSVIAEALPSADGRGGSKKIAIPEEAKGFVNSWRRKISFAALITTIMMVSVIGLSTVVGYFALSTVYENKVKDTWAIQFLELEELANSFGRKLNARRNEATRLEVPVAIFRRSGESLEPLTGPFKGKIKLSGLGIDAPSFGGDQLTVATRDGRTYLAAPMTTDQVSSWTNGATGKEGFLVLYPLDFVQSLGLSDKKGGKALFYVLTTLGSKVFATDASIGARNAQERPLVQAFIRAPLAQGQVTFTDGRGAASYGFFHHVPEANVVFFSETSKAFALRDVYEILGGFAAIVAFAIVAVFLISQVPLQIVARQIRDLVGLAIEIGRGNFLATPKHAGFGELWFLNQAFGAMAQSLGMRDRKIVALQAEQQEKFRLAGELALARRIQDNLLPREALPPAAPFDLAASYEPATEVAGDWYGFAYDERRGELVTAVADVTGHGAGAAMFTSVIAAAFEELRTSPSPVDGFDLTAFAQRANRLLFALGRGEWFASLVAIRVRAGEGSLELISAGHLPGLLINKKKHKSLMMSGPLLGIDAKLELQPKLFPFARGDIAVLFTDGITEAKNAAGAMFGKRRLREASTVTDGQSAEMLRKRIVDEWQRHCGTVPKNDDACLVVIKAR